LQMGREQFAQRLAKTFEPADALSQSGQLGQGGVGAAAAIEEAIDLVHDLPQISQVRPAAGDPPQGLAVGGGQVALDNEMAILEQVGDFPFDAVIAGGQVAAALRGPAPAEWGQGVLELSPDLGDRLEDRFGQFGDDVEFTDLVGNRTEDLRNRRRIQRRTIRGNALKAQAAAGQPMIEDLVDQPLKVAVIHDGQDAVRSVVEFVRGDVAVEVRQGGVEVVSRDAFFGSFFPPLPPSSEWWQTGQRRGGRAISATTPNGRAGRPRPPAERPGRRPDGCNDRWGPPGPTGRR